MPRVSLARWHCGFLFPAKWAARQGGAHKEGPLTWRCQRQRGICVQGVQVTLRCPDPRLPLLTPSVGCPWWLTSSEQKAAEGTDVIPNQAPQKRLQSRVHPPCRLPRVSFLRTGPSGKGQALPRANVQVGGRGKDSHRSARRGDPGRPLAAHGSSDVSRGCGNEAVTTRRDQEGRRGLSRRRERPGEPETS